MVLLGSAKLVRAIYSRRIISAGSITNAFKGCDREIDQKIAYSIFHYHHFSTYARKQIDGKLGQILKSEIKFKELFQVTCPGPKDRFLPFKIKDDDCEKSSTLTRDLDGEKIEVVVVMPSNIPQDYEGDSDYMIDDYEDNIYDHAHDSQPLALKVMVSKQNAKTTVEFHVSASFREIKINSLLFREPTFGPFAVEEEGDLQVSLREFLKIRGIKKSIYGLMFDHMVYKSRGARVNALIKLNEFIKD